jgi:hypothetical protein
MFLVRISYALWYEDKLVSGDKASSFLTSAVDGGEWSASRPGRFNPGEEATVPIALESGWLTGLL